MKKYRHTHRSVILFFLLTPLTVFIYPTVVLHHIGKEVNRMNEGVEGYKKSMPYLGAFLLGFITLFIVPLVWLCRVARKLGEKGTELGIARPHTSALSFFFLCILFSEFIITLIIGWTKFLHTANAVERKLNENVELAATAEAQAEILTEQAPEEAKTEEGKEEPVSEATPETEPQEEKPVEEEKKEEGPAPFEYVTEPERTISDPNEPRSDIKAIYRVAQRQETRKWRVRVPNSNLPDKTFDSREEAVAYAKGLAARKHATVRVKSK